MKHYFALQSICNHKVSKNYGKCMFTFAKVHRPMPDLPDHQSRPCEKSGSLFSIYSYVIYEHLTKGETPFANKSTLNKIMSVI